MPNYPIALKQRNEINLRQGIKTSMPKIKSLFALTFVLYELNEFKCTLDFSKEIVSGGQKKIVLTDEFEKNILDYFDIKEEFSNDFLNAINQNPLFTSQLEALQVTLELFWRLGKIHFVKEMSSSSERTGNDRFQKVILFSTNMDILQTALYENKDLLKETLFNWIYEKNDLTRYGDRIKQLLTIFSEETQFKIRNEQREDILFQQEGIYQEIIDNGNVVSKDAHESVGPYRIFKNFVDKGLHRFITEKDGRFSLDKDESQANFIEYRRKVGIYLDLIPKKTTIFETETNSEDESALSAYAEVVIKATNKIYFGCPGTGKSYQMKKDTEGYKRFGTTFHPEYDYAAFVGSYKPKMDGKEITYDFTPQIFTKAYVYAYQNPNENVVLAIEEINRGNCAMIFGDIFQLLDRKSTGESEYDDVTPDADLLIYLKSQLGEDTEKLKLPSNLSIMATMNTSDQSLFPMDSAFKRRWEWKYVPIELASEDAKKMVFSVNSKNYSWVEFLEKVNTKIYALTQSEDKQLGTFFVSGEPEITETQFKTKVMFYLWYDVFKNEIESEHNIFSEKGKNPTTFSDLFRDERLLETILTRLDITPI